jgi:hypothetical protein
MTINNSWSLADTKALINSNILPGKVVNGITNISFPGSCPPVSDIQRYNRQHPNQLTASAADRLKQGGGAPAPKLYHTTLPFCRAGFTEVNLGPHQLSDSTAKIKSQALQANAWAESQNAAAAPSSGGGKRRKRAFNRRKSRKSRKSRKYKNRKSRKSRKYKNRKSRRRKH